MSPAPGATPPSGPEVVPGPLRMAVVLIVLEAVALLGAGVVLVAKTITGTPELVWRGLAAAGLAVLGAVFLAYAARALWRLRPAARSPVVVLELVALPVGYSLAFQAGRVGYGGPILVAALAVVFLLFTPPARRALDRDV